MDEKKIGDYYKESIVDDFDGYDRKTFVIDTELIITSILNLKGIRSTTVHMSDRDLNAIIECLVYSYFADDVETWDSTILDILVSTGFTINIARPLIKDLHDLIKPIITNVFNIANREMFLGIEIKTNIAELSFKNNKPINIF